ncbi:MAG: hypothetical protein HOC70_17455 [Gammaproteobacteria bacterium]|jgi:membrane protein involved in colicin uptake|nr:hypothetical protein [Gammaproteobacteria bacterium]MBT4255742.1 hypothetical protein [Gammaproteobacteria bacterium]MBT4495032.1 hypothetical protein [Gammaproteobacteria bacterium]
MNPILLFALVFYIHPSLANQSAEVSAAVIMEPERVLQTSGSSNDPFQTHANRSSRLYLADLEQRKTEFKNLVRTLHEAEQERIREANKPSAWELERQARERERNRERRISSNKAKQATKQSRERMLREQEKSRQAWSSGVPSITLTGTPTPPPRVYPTKTVKPVPKKARAVKKTIEYKPCTSQPCSRGVD